MDAVELPLPMPDDELLALDEALDRLATVDARAAEMVKLCFFVGLTQEQAAQGTGRLAEHGGTALGIRPRLAFPGDAEDTRSGLREPGEDF